ncbi:MAG: hypothetical protein PVG65_06515 [Candidatus Thorarchaeota archaeon]
MDDLSAGEILEGLPVYDYSFVGWGIVITLNGKGWGIVITLSPFPWGFLITLISFYWGIVVTLDIDISFTYCL